MRSLRDEVSFEVSQLSAKVILAEFELKAMVANIVLNLTSTDSI
jgi:hypothetical protein